MGNETSTLTEPLSEKLSHTAAHVKHKASQVKHKASRMSQKAVDSIDEQRAGAAAGLEKAASTLHDQAENLPGGEKVAHFAHATADKLSTTAEYVREHDLRAMASDAESAVKRNPAPALLAAAAAGFLTGLLFRRGRR
jgi:ElaB/YqjD/DUF883 family membrane-anchored ribosome-binding protein